jgi:molybdopterin-guanine dinucleotide biosynthesis protein A
MVEAKLLRKKLKDGLIVDKWDLVTIIEKQEAEIDSLRKNLDVALMMVDDLEKGLDSSINLNKAQALRKAQEK